MPKIEAPWTPEQVEALNRWQDPKNTVALICPRDESVLIATVEGLHCPRCDYTRTWAHEFMLEPPPSSFIADPDDDEEVDDD